MVTFEEARINERLRQEYISDLFRRNPTPYVENVNYKTINTIADFLKRFRRGDHAMATGYWIKEFGSQQTQAAIYVYPLAFRALSEGDFEIALTDHEYAHAQDFYMGIDLGKGVTLDWAAISDNGIDRGLLYALTEIRGLSSGLKGGLRKGISRELLIQTLENADRYLRRVRSYKPKNDLESMMVKKALEDGKILEVIKAK